MEYVPTLGKLSPHPSRDGVGVSGFLVQLQDHHPRAPPEAGEGQPVLCGRSSRSSPLSAWSRELSRSEGWAGVDRPGG